MTIKLKLAAWPNKSRYLAPCFSLTVLTQRPATLHQLVLQNGLVRTVLQIRSE